MAGRYMEVRKGVGQVAAGLDAGGGLCTSRTDSARVRDSRYRPNGMVSGSGKESSCERSRCKDWELLALQVLRFSWRQHRQEQR